MSNGKVDLFGCYEITERTIVADCQEAYTDILMQAGTIFIILLAD